MEVFIAMTVIPTTVVTMMATNNAMIVRDILTILTRFITAMAKKFMFAPTAATATMRIAKNEIIII